MIRNKTMRSLDNAAAKAQSDIERDLQGVESALLDFSGDADKQNFSRELAVVESKKQALMQATHNLVVCR